MKQEQKTLSEFNKIPLISSSKGKEETQKEANAFAAPFKRKNFSSEEGDREKEEEEKKRSKGSEEGDAYGEDEDKNTPPTRAAPTARERTTLKETEEDDDDDPPVAPPSPSPSPVPLSEARTARVLGPQSRALEGTSMVRNSESLDGDWR